MVGSTWIEVGIILLLVLANGVFSMSELAIVSARRMRLKQAAEAGDRGARVALRLAEDPNRLLSTVQIGITLVGTLAGVFGGATIAEAVARELGRIPSIAPYAKVIGLTIVVGGISFLTLILGELVPKRLALRNPERIASWTARPLAALAMLGIPLVVLLGWCTDAVLRLIGLGSTQSNSVTEEEIQGMVREGAEAGVIETAEHDMVRRVFRLNDYPVRVLMTPRSSVAWIDSESAPGEVRDQVLASPHSRFPVCGGSLDNVVGIVEAKDLLGRGLVGEPRTLDLRGLVKMPLFIYGGMTALRLLEQFKRSKSALAIVLDEFGAVQGLITLNDILEALVGDIPGDADEPNPRAVQREDGSWLLDGAIPIAEFRDLLPLPPLPANGFDTLAGFVLHILGKIPRIADRFDWGGYTFEVVDMDGNRIDRVLVAPRDDSPSTAASA
ncbi:MAG: hemolysin family protein [Isosphaeraceae bacterium]|nr:hemolysin family protein [Isosphaeraceae bacterium]